MQCKLMSEIRNAFYGQWCYY